VDHRSQHQHCTGNGHVPRSAFAPVRVVAALRRRLRGSCLVPPLTPFLHTPHTTGPNAAAHCATAGPVRRRLQWADAGAAVAGQAHADGAQASRTPARAKVTIEKGKNPIEHQWKQQPCCMGRFLGSVRFTSRTLSPHVTPGACGEANRTRPPCLPILGTDNEPRFWFGLIMKGTLGRCSRWWSGTTSSSSPSCWQVMH